ncbi:MAG: hypothetical protein Q4G24_14730 [Paracoccus sp. (in: a-proteobacteria)]|uniref:hypothetical protein n=1 Tax=Paracoccus sp. TaxID=267 RepID=UPI0026DFD0B0|nr:hypothetical protein [Paracoccus sp. (in: a-proteobacteria)]MDO5622712.1 hypothetical protein [Paracoccus sp. (in: a-proteobacteria)]
MTHLIVHIGAHKTATTALQTLLTDSGALLARANIVYPRVNWCNIAQHRLAFALKNMRDPVRGDIPDAGTEIDELNAVLAKNPGKSVLVSSEELFTLRPEALAQLRSRLRADWVRIIACVRRPDEMLLSIYNQKAKSPNNRFTMPLRFFLDKPRQIDPDIAYGQQLGKWADHFGENALTVFTYEQGPPVQTFLALLGIEAPHVPGRGENRSVPAPVVELMRIAKAHDFPAHLQQKLYHLAVQRFTNAPKLTLTQAERLSLFRILKDEYSEIFARLGRENPYPPSLVEDLPDTNGAAPPPPLTFRDMLSLIQALM